MTAKRGTPPINGAYESEEVSRATERIIAGAKPILPELSQAVVYRDGRRLPPSPYAGGAGTVDVSALGDHRVWDLTVRCWGAHNRLAQELDHVGDGRNAQTIDALGDDRRDTAMELARTDSQTLHGVLWKKDILLLFLGSDEEARALLSSCLSDCDRLLGVKDGGTLSAVEPPLARAVARVAEVAEQLAFEAERSDDCDGDGREEDRAKLVSSIEALSAELETAIEVVADSTAITFVGLRAKLKLYKTFADGGITPCAFSVLRRSMFDDLDRLVRRHAAMRGLPAAEERLLLI